MTSSQLKSSFIKIYGGTGDGLRVFTAPGRVNLIGEHTDYNGGFVFPAALTLSSTVVARPRPDRKIRLCATDLNTIVEADLDQLESCRHLDWGSYQLGVALMLQKAGWPMTGCDLLYHETVPFGAGLSSSAAIEVVTAFALMSLENATSGIGKEIDLVELARLCQKAENEYIGVNCGIMDQFASALGKKGHALLLNCKSLDYVHVPLRLDGYQLVIANTNKIRSLAESKYNERRKECEFGLQILKRSLPDVACLGDISYKQFLQYRDTIKFINVRGRVEHVISEDDRVLRTAMALKNGDLELCGKLMTASHESLRTLYEVTGPELDALVEEALMVDGVLGSRMTGAGFGGCTVSIVREDAIAHFKQSVGENYRRRTGLTAAFYLSEIGDGVREIQ